MKKTLATLAACAAVALPNGAAIAQQNATVASSLPMISSLISALLQGTDIKHSLLMGPSDTIHSRNMTPSIIRNLSEAGVVVVNGQGEPDFLTPTRLTQTVASDAVILDLMRDFQLDLIDSCEDTASEQHEEHDDEHGHGHENCFDEHIWLGLDNLAQMQEFIAAELARAFPASSAKIHANRKASLDKLDLLDKQIATALAKASVQKVVVWHDAYAYFARHHKLPAYVSVNQADVHGASLSGKRFEWLLGELKQDDACLIFASQEERDLHLASLQREIPALRHAVADPVGYGKDPKDPDLVSLVLLDIATAFANCSD